MKALAVSRLGRLVQKLLPRHVRPGAPHPVYINGLVESIGRNGSKVVVFDPTKVRRSPGHKLMEEVSDNRGEVHGFIDPIYNGKRLQVVVFSDGYKNHDFEVILPNHGLHLPIKLEKDLNFNGTTHYDFDGSLTYWNGWKSGQRYADAQQKSDVKSRKARRGSSIAWLIDVSGALILGAIGFVVHPVVGVSLSITWFVVSYIWISPRAAGLD